MGCLKKRGWMQRWQWWADECLLGTERERERGHMKGIPEYLTNTSTSTHPNSISWCKVVVHHRMGSDLSHVIINCLIILITLHVKLNRQSRLRVCVINRVQSEGQSLVDL